MIEQLHARISALEREKVAQKEMFDERCRKYEADLADYTRGKRLAAKSSTPAPVPSTPGTSSSLVVQVLKEDDLINLIDYTLCETFWSEFRREMNSSKEVVQFCYYLARKKLKYYANDSDYRDLASLLSTLGASMSTKNGKAMNIHDLIQEFKGAGRVEIAKQLEEFLAAALVNPRFKNYMVKVDE